MALNKFCFIWLNLAFSFIFDSLYDKHKIRQSSDKVGMNDKFISFLFYDRKGRMSFRFLSWESLVSKTNWIHTSETINLRTSEPPSLSWHCSGRWWCHLLHLPHLYTSIVLPSTLKWVLLFADGDDMMTEDEIEHELVAEAETAWAQREWSIQHVLFPSMRLFFKPPNSMATNGTFVRVS